jgi:ferredoxin
LVFGPSRNNARSSCDIILDLTGGPAFFPAADLRDGYLRADPGNPAAMLQAVLKARDLIGTFEKPRYVTFDAALCAHSRSQVVGCTRCLDLCPTAAITPAGDHVAIDANICAGCGQCAAACPTGAASYALPPEDALMRKLRAMLIAYREAGGEQAIVLVHDDPHGAPLIDALARFGDGLPAHVLPFAVNETRQIGLESIAAAFAYGASAMRFLLRARPLHDVSGLRQTMALADPILTGLGFGDGRIAAIETDDPDLLIEALRAIPSMPSAPRPASFRAVGRKRDVLHFALSELHRSAPAPVDIIALPEGAPFGAVEIDVGGCTLCLSCVSACPTGALRDDPERPMLRFVEDACVQCGLCQATCPEKVITLKPQIDFRAARAPLPVSSRRRSRSAASAAASRSASRARSSAWWKNSKASTGCTPAHPGGSTSSRCATIVASLSSRSKASILTARKAKRSAPPTTIFVSGRRRSATARTSVKLRVLLPAKMLVLLLRK